MTSPFKDRSKPQEFGVSYMNRAMTDVSSIIRDLREMTRGVKYDTIVVTGSSGMMVGPILARALRKNVFVVRKEAEFQSSHSYSKYLGTLGLRWIFVDDFCSSGETFRRVRDGVVDAVRDINSPRVWWDAQSNSTIVENADDVEPFETELVGYFEYQQPEHNGGSVFTLWDELAEPGHSSYYLGDTPRMIAHKAREEARQAERDEAVQVPPWVEGRLIEVDEIELDWNTAPRYRPELAVSTTIPTVGDYRSTLAKVQAEQICDEPNCIVCTEEAKSIMAETADRVPATLEELMQS